MNDLVLRPKQVGEYPDTVETAVLCRAWDGHQYALRLGAARGSVSVSAGLEVDHSVSHFKSPPLRRAACIVGYGKDLLMEEVRW